MTGPSGMIAVGIGFNPIDWVTDAAGAVVDGVATSVLDGIVSWLEDGMRYVAGAVAQELAGFESLDLGSQTAQQMSGVVRWIAIAVALGSILASAAMASAHAPTIAAVSPRCSRASSRTG